MSSRSSASEICICSQTSAACRRWPARPAWMRIDASVTRRAMRSGRIAASARRVRAVRRGGRGSGAAGATGGASSSAGREPSAPSRWRS